MRNLNNYFPILIFITLGVALALTLMLVSWFRGKQAPYAEKQSPYECGFEAFDLPLENARKRFDIQFYLVAILFIIFDIEIIFLFPYAVTLEKIGWFGYSSMMIFLSILTIGFIYEWKKGALEWHSV